MADYTDFALDPDFLDEITGGIVDETVDILMAVVEAMTAPGGRTFGQIDLGHDRVQRLLSFLADAQTGVLDMEIDLSPKQGERAVRTAVADARALGIAPDTLAIGRFLPRIAKAKQEMTTNA